MPDKSQNLARRRADYEKIFLSQRKRRSVLKPGQFETRELVWFHNVSFLNYLRSWSQFGVMRRDLYYWKAEKTLIPNIYSIFALEA